MTREELQNQYKKLGAYRPELVLITDAQKSHNIGDKNSRRSNSFIRSIEPKDTTTMDTQNGTHEIPAPAPVARKVEQVSIKLTHTLGQRAAERSVDGFVLGAFAVGVGAALLALSNVILKPQ